MTYANQRRVFGKTEYHKPSLFLGEIPDKCKDDITPKPKFGIGDMSYSFTEKKVQQTVNFKSFAREATSAPIKFEFAKGDRVVHAKFGEGTVLEAQAVGNDMRLKINFDAHGEKNLMAVYAKLTKLN